MTKKSKQFLVPSALLVVGLSASLVWSCKPRVSDRRTGGGGVGSVSPETETENGLEPKPGTQGEQSANPGAATPEAAENSASEQTSAGNDVCGKIVKADVVALDQPYTYNRFGSFNPVGMMYALKRDVVAADSNLPVGAGNARLRANKRPRPLVLRVNEGDCLEITFTNWLAPKRADISDANLNNVYHRAVTESHENDSPATRVASIHVNGLSYLNIGSDGANVGRNPSSLAAPGQTLVYKLYAEKEGAFFMHSSGATIGGEGDGGQIVQGLFGAVHVEPKGSTWYRSQVTAEILSAVKSGTNPDGSPIINFDAVDASGVPYLRMLSDTNEIVHTDLNAIVRGYAKSSVGGTPSSIERGFFREFTVIFHDETKTVQAFDELETHTLQGVKDGFGINYGVAGAGAMVLANRKKIGPTKNCADCRMEEFFLESWAGGDPALNIRKNASGVAVAAMFPDDPSNVHHSYVGDPVRFRNLHAGPKEHHVFHLHAHQWLKTPNNPNSIYLDSQTIGPQATYTYDINYNGAGNRNLMVGDSIFHCHLYPHFAMGMWELWRHHDVFEDGNPQRNLPDAEIAGGTPTPAVIPIPELPMAPMPTYSTTTATHNGQSVQRPAHPGYPHYIAAQPGFRTSQAPYDIKWNGGMPRHLALGAPNEAGAVLSGYNGDAGTRGLLDVVVKKAFIKLLPEDGTPQEKLAMNFHAGSFPFAQNVTTAYGWAAKGYPAYSALGKQGLFVVNGRPPVPGAPFSDPCPANAPQRNYRGVYVQTDIVATKNGWHDPQGRFIVLNEDYDATLSGSRKPEPLFFRANSGDCVNFYASNAMPDALDQDDFQIFTPTDIIGQHIHLVKFDVTASDGSGNGWNYEDGTFSYEEVLHKIEAANAVGGAYAANGATTPSPDDQRVTLEAEKNPWLSATAPAGVQTTSQRWWVDPLVNETGFDRTIGTVFTHDHFGPSSHQQHGFYAALVIEPKDSTWAHPETGVAFGTRQDGGPTSWQAIITAGANGADSFREFNLAISDFALLYDGVRPVVPPKQEVVGLPNIVKFPLGAPTPEVISISDPGLTLLNYRAEPLPARLGRPSAGPGSQYVLNTGDKGNPAHVFSSIVHEDPFTPVLKGYEGDRVKIRWVAGGQEETHAVFVAGHSWNREPDDTDSGKAAAQNIGLSEHFEFVLSNGLAAVKNVRGTADYLLGATSTDDLWGGAWGLLRAYDRQRADVLPLPNNPVPNIPPRPISACPLGAKPREYNVVATTARDALPNGRLVYNQKFGIYDDDAIIFAIEGQLAQLKAGTRKPEPLILRASSGECVKVTLKNRLPATLPKKPHWNFYQPITEFFNVNQIPMSSFVGLQPQLLTYDVNRSDGASVGYNENTLVAPGKERVYEWYAGEYKIDALRPSDRRISTPIEYGVVNLRNMGDVVNHPSKGASGGVLIVEPTGATWVADPTENAQATVSYMENGKQASFREFVQVYFDEGGVFTTNTSYTGVSHPALPNPGMPSGPDAGHNGEPAELDAEDAGFKGLNLRSEPLWARMRVPPSAIPFATNDIQQGNLLSSAVHGDPETPVFKAKLGVPRRLRIGMPSSHTRNHVFTWSGSQWHANPWKLGTGGKIIGSNPRNRMMGAIDGLTAGGHYNVVPFHVAGGRFKVPGDYLYRDAPSNSFTSGVWGIERVEP